MELVSRLERPLTGYREDFAAWADCQADLLRAGRLGALDLENVIEEIESLGKSERAAIGSQIDRIIEHLLKLIYSPAREPRRGWRESIRNARREVERLHDASPSLRREAGAMVEELLPRARRDAAATLLDYGEVDRERAAAMRAHNFTPEQILGDWFPPET